MAANRIALIPIKDFKLAKSRLAEVLSLGERQALARWMFKRVLDELNGSGLFSEIVILSKGFKAQGLEKFPARIIEQDPGLELEEALNVYLKNPLAILEHLILPADLPLLSQRDFWGLEHFLKKADPQTLLIPSMDGRGTNGLYLKNPKGFKVAFGRKDSFGVNLSELRGQGMEPTLYYSLGFALDVDTKEDLLWAFHNGLPFRGLV
jgi:2-phospho-L-lactate guanylyltransferase